MKFRTTLILLLCVLLLGAFIGLFERRTASTREREEQARRAVKVDAAAASYLRIETTNFVVECVKEGGTWVLRQPVGAGAEDGAVERIVQGLQDLTRGEVITEAEQHARGVGPAAYGFDMPRAKFTVGDSLRRQTLLVGGRALLGGSLYIKEESRPDIVGTDTNLLALIPASVADLRDRTLFHGRPEEVRRVSLSNAAGFLQAGRDDRGRWTILQPVSVRASPTALQDLIYALFDLRVKDFAADGVKDFVPFRLDDPAIKVSVGPVDGGGEASLWFGGASATNRELVYARLVDGESVYAVGTGIVGRLGAKLEDLRDRRLVPMSSYDIEYVRLQEGERVVELRKNGEAWNVTEPKPCRADGERVRELLRTWASARIAAFAADGVTNPAARGMEPAARVLRFARKAPATNGAPRAGDLEEDVTIRVGSQKGEDDRLQVMADGEASLYEVAPDLMNPVSLDPLYYRDREVLSLDPDEVVRVTVLRGEDEQAVERDGEGRFAAVGAAGIAVDQDRIADVLAAAARLRVEEFVADDPGTLEAFGLETPASVVTFGLRDETGMGKSLLFGRPAGPDGVYAMLRGQDAVFVLERGFQDILTGPLFAPAARREEPPVDRRPAKTVEP